MTQLTPLQQEIFSTIEKEGAIPFRDFMYLALYHHQYGYYTSGEPPMGPAGDFITSPEISPFFGRLIARQLEEMWEKLERPAPFHIVEFGPGRGFLAHAILEALSSQPLKESLLYHLVEISPALRQQQRDRLSSLPYPIYEAPSRAMAGSYGWSTPEELPKGVCGCVLTNEFLDALPVHRLQWTEGRFVELYVTNSSDGDEPFQWQKGPLSDPRLLSWVDQHISGENIVLDEGQVVDVNMAATDWLSAVDGLLQQGFILTIDYGHQAPELYDNVRMDGTLMCYHQHRADPDPLSEAGEKDMTAHLDFSALQKVGTELGWHNLGLTNQMWFLSGLLRPDDFATTSEMTVQEFRQRQALKKLLMPGGMGEIFKVLIQSKGVYTDSLLGLHQLRLR
ncbi:SAM-dependent methyltransferase [Heliobacterium chlorum]|uniref:SAM-dependent methyltransferase n=1 Tax=Heliobacterium chlorum TaxID=2698 RepID=A0ABR7SYF1_HELCL|nr:SAM-dependent methyltransferase [Heliobacterium chlorum]MBC9782982.1 SAM-dependent methyltransferase [Heliobacterium chlorum]